MCIRDRIRGQRFGILLLVARESAGPAFAVSPIMLHDYGRRIRERRDEIVARPRHDRRIVIHPAEFPAGRISPDRMQDLEQRPGCLLYTSQLGRMLETSRNGHRPHQIAILFIL